MALIGPAFLTIGTEVSAKYRGAFCEAKVKKAVKCVKLRVTGKDSPTSIWITDDQIVVGVMKVGSVVQFKQADSGQMTEGVVNKVNDNSTYTVVFDDGDERTLRRNQLVLKGDKHFDVSETLDNLPLSHPEHFGTPVLKTKKTARNRPGDSDSDGSSSEDESQKRASYISRHQALVGKVMLAEVADKRKGGSPTPVLVVMPDAHPVELKHRDQLLVRSFRDTKFLVVYRKDLKGFSREAAIKNEDKALKAAFEKALLFFDNSELPSNWNRAELLGPDDGEEGEETSDDETQCEQRDHFVAQLYKFMDDRGTPINKGPCIGNKDLNLYRLFKVVQNIGGYNKATNQMKWRLVYSKMGLPPSNQAAHQIKNAYKKYLHAFEDFYRKLGSIMGTISRPGRQSRHTPSRGILAFRGRDASPRSPRPEKPAVSKEDKAKEEEKAKAKAEESNTVEQTVAAEAKETTPAEEADDTVRRSTPRREKAQSQKEEPKSDKKEDGKVKKEDQKVKKEEVKKEDQKVKKEEDKKEDQRVKKEEDKKEEASKEEKKKEEKREERKSLRQSQKDKEEEKKEAVKTKEEEKKEVKKEEGKTVRVLRKDLNDKEEEEKKEPEDTKEAQKKRVSRRKQTRVEEEKKEGEDKEEEEEKVEEKKAEEKKAEEKKVEEKKEKKKAPTSAKKEKAAPKKKAEEEENEAKDKESENESDDDSSSSSTQDQEFLSVGTRLKVRYGRGRNHKIYEAKVIEHKNVDPHKKYRVHYAGWNTRYDEWVETERIVKVIDQPELTKLKKKPLTAKSLKASTAQAAVKNEIPFLKKRGRQPSTQQAPSPGATGTGSSLGTGTKPSPSPTPSPSPSPAAGEAKVSKVKASLTPTSALSKTRSMRSTSTEIKPEAAATATSAAKQRITRRSSGVNESADEPVTGEAEEGSESANDVECAPAGDGEADGVSEHPEQDEVTEPAPDTKVEEEEEETPPPVEAAVETKPAAPQEEDSVVVKPDESKRPEVDGESLPPVTAVTKTECATETEPVPQPSPRPRQASPAPEDNAVSLKDSSEPPPHPASPPQVEEPQVPPVTEEVREEHETEESDPPLATVAKEEVVVKKDTPAEEEKAIEPGCVEMPAGNQPEGEKTAPLPDPAIPHLKKIDLDLPPAEDKKEGKEKAKPGKKLGREFKKSRQSEMRTSFSEIPTLEPMTSPEGDVKPTPADVKPSPYDFNDTEADSPSSWQPEITKKWEPNNKSASLYRDVKNTLKKSLETDKKKVKKKNKKAAEEASGESESPSKPSEKAKDLSVVKKGRRKRTAEGEVKVDTSSYEETVNSVVESCKNDDFTGISVPLPPSLETKEEKGTKKRKKMLQCNASPEADVAQEGKKEPAKPVKALKGKVGRKKKEVKTAESVTDQNANPNSLSVPSFDVHISPSSSHQDKPPSSSEPCEALSVKQPCSEGGMPSATLIGSCAQGLLVPAPMAGPSGLHMLSMASIRPVPSTSGAAGAGPSDRLAPLLEGVACEGVKQAPPDPPRVDCAGDMPKRVGSTVLDNTPPTTPENDLDEANSASSSSEAHDNLKEDLDSLDSAERTCKGGSESPPGCDFSLSSTSSENLPSSSSGAQSNGPPSQSSEPVSAKRKKKEDPAAASVKKKRRLASRSTRGERNKKSPKYGDDDSHSRSPLHHNHSDSGLVPTANSEAMKSGIPRQRKFHFTDDLGEHLEGEERIQFLLDKMKEIRRVYQCIKARAAAIDRKRKRARRMEKERESTVDQSLMLPDVPEHSRPAPAFTAEQAPASSPEQVGTCQPEVTPVEAGTSRPASSPEGIGTSRPASSSPEGIGTSQPASSPDGIGTSPPALSLGGIGTSPPASSLDGIGTSPPASSLDGIGTSPPASSPEGIGTTPPAPTYLQGCWVLVGLAVTGSRQQRHVDYVGKVLFHDEETEEAQIKWLKSRGWHYIWPTADYVTWESVRDIKKIMRNPETCGRGRLRF